MASTTQAAIATTQAAVAAMFALLAANLGAFFAGEALASPAP